MVNRFGLKESESVRKRPALYVGSTGFWGLIRHLVEAFELMRKAGATWIEFELIPPGDFGQQMECIVCSNGRLRIEKNERGCVSPFEDFDVNPDEDRATFDLFMHAPVVCGLSASLTVQSQDGEKITTAKFVCGNCESYSQSASSEEGDSLEVRFIPDQTLFEVSSVSIQNLYSYCRRNAAFYPELEYRVKLGDEVRTYKSSNGLQDLFDSFAHPCQTLHLPIRIREQDEDFKVEAIFAMHGWSNNLIQSFANKGFVPEGGPHIEGFLEALQPLYSQPAAASGVIAVIAIEYIPIGWAGAIKARLINSELREKMKCLVERGLEKWIQENPEEREHLKQVERFRCSNNW
ncbi:MAG: hypothetical protein KDA65_16710 [Planctomycetaceae bacterium]|nr:hypothetical protein [Planctomycetaceae bacterium]